MTTRIIAPVFACAGVALGALCPIAAAAPGDTTRMEHAVQALVSQGHFMGAVLVAKNGKVLLDRGYGSANLELKVPDTPTTKFRLGSVTKQFTAASILLLQERGQLKVTDPVSKYLPDAPAAWSQITIFNLLTHTSGIPTYSEFPDFNATKAVAATPGQLVARFRDKPLEFQPGSDWKYSNSGYALLGYLIEKISTEAYGKFVQDNIFAPLGMKDSGYDSNADIIYGRAEGYTPGPNGSAINAEYIDMSVPYAAGGLYSTVEDLLRWEQGLYGGKLLSAVSLQQMTTPFMNEYALGLSVHNAPNGEKIITHGGGIYGFNSQLTYVPADKLAVIVLGNLNGPAARLIAGQLTDIALHVVTPPRLPPQSIDESEQ